MIDDALRVTSCCFLILFGFLSVSTGGAAPEERDVICEKFKGTTLWGACTRAVTHGCHLDAKGHPRCRQWAKKWKELAGIPAIWEVECAGTGSRCVFVTSQTFPGELAGLSEAQMQCQSLAFAAGLPGEYDVWLSTPSASEPSSPASRFERSDIQYLLVNGDQVAADWYQLTHGALEHSINVTEVGDTVSEECRSPNCNLVSLPVAGELRIKIRLHPIQRVTTNIASA